MRLSRYASGSWSQVFKSTFQHLVYPWQGLIVIYCILQLNTVKNSYIQFNAVQLRGVFGFLIFFGDISGVYAISDEFFWCFIRLFLHYTKYVKDPI